jgi:hypothetical protein
MKKIELEERVNHLERGLRLLGDDLEGAKRLKQEIEDIKAEIKALKIFLGRINPDFKSQYPEIVKKLKG